MKNYSFYLLGFLLTSILFSNCDVAGNLAIIGNGKTDFSIQITGLENQQCRLLGYFGESYFQVDDILSDAQGVFEIQQDTALDNGLYFFVLPDGKTFVQLLIDEDQEFSLTTSRNDLVGQMKVEGSTSNQAFYESATIENEIGSRLSAISSRLSTAQEGSDLYGELILQRQSVITERQNFIKEITSKYAGTFFSMFKLAGQNPILRDIRNPDGSSNQDAQVYHYRNEFWDNVDFSDASLLRTPVFHNKLSRYISELVPQHGDSLVKYSNIITNHVINNPVLFKYTVNYIAIKYRDGTMMDWEKVYANIVQNYFTEELATWSTPLEIKQLRNQVIPMISSGIGSPAQNFVCRDRNGNEIALLDVPSKYIVLFIYNPTCSNCIKETPELINFYNQWRDQGVEVYAVSFDATREQWEEYLGEYNPPWKYHVFDQNNDSKFGYKYQVDHTPEIYVINEERKIIGKNIKTAQIATVINRDRGVE